MGTCLPRSLVPPARDRVVDPAPELSVAGYGQWLQERGYAASTRRVYRASVEHFLQWQAGQQPSCDELDETVVQRFLTEHLPHCTCAPGCLRWRHTVRAALARWLAWLRGTGQLATAPMATDSPAVVQALDDFERYLRDVRGVRPMTRVSRRRQIRHLLLHRFGTGPVEISSLTRADLREFLTTYTATWSPASRGVVCQALRSYLRFHALQGAPVEGLLPAVPRIVSRRLARLPQSLSAAETMQLLDAFDRTTAVGCRDYAMARCLVDLGLRSCELASLTLDDVDWQAGTLRIRGKGGRTDLLPLPAATGRAVVAYLRHGRPTTPTSRALFVRHRAPLDAPMTPTLVGGVMRRAAARAGLTGRVSGPHALRHTAAQRLLDGGAKLKDIADILRHRSLDTTMIYTKIDLPALRQVALPWLGRLP